MSRPDDKIQRPKEWDGELERRRCCAALTATLRRLTNPFIEEGVYLTPRLA